MKKIIIFISVAGATMMKGQENYCDFEGMKKIHFGEHNGFLDTTAANPGTNAVNMSATCARYIRDTALYDNIKMYPFNKLIDVAPYASTSPTAPRLQMKIYTSAAPGTSISIQLGSRTNTTYPGGIHSEYMATTAVQNAWQLLTFNYMYTTPGGFASSTDINKIIVLFHPNSHARDTIYFDDPTGPETIPVGIPEIAPGPAKLFQNEPNPASDNTSIRLQIIRQGYVSLKVYDMLGKPVSILVDKELAVGVHNIPVNISNMPGGIYFYVLRTDGAIQSRRMVISK
jgi:hypothetical protein